MDEHCLSNKKYEILNANEFCLTALPVKQRNLECTMKISTVFRLNVVGSHCRVKFGYVLDFSLIKVDFIFKMVQIANEGEIVSFWSIFLTFQIIYSFVEYSLAIEQLHLKRDDQPELYFLLFAPNS